MTKKDHIWNTYTDGFTSHMTIDSFLEKNDAIKIIDKINTNPIKVKLIGNLYQNKFNNFYSLQYDIQIIDSKIPDFWPKDPHISFKYRYNKPFTKEECNILNNQITEKYGILERVEINNCSQHYSKWLKF